MKGLPASGKSTRAKEIMKKDGNCLRVNKDLLREMLHFNKWSGKKESQTSFSAVTLVTQLLANKYNVIIDDTNLNPKTLEAWVKITKATENKHEIINLDTHWTDCVSRDNDRKARGERFVGRHVIVNMARQYGLYEFDKPDIICDIDGTLCDMTHRLHYVKDMPYLCEYCGEEMGTRLVGDESVDYCVECKRPSPNAVQVKKDWHGFFKATVDDSPKQQVIDFVNSKATTHSIVLVSGRPDTYREETEQWLKDHMVTYQTLIMRKGGDSREDTIIKKEILDTYFKKDNIELVVDDRPRIIRMWQAEGLKVWDVGSGVEF